MSDGEIKTEEEKKAKPEQKEGSDESLRRMSELGWKAEPGAEQTAKKNERDLLAQLESARPFRATEDKLLREYLEKLTKLNEKSGAGDSGALRKFQSFYVHINAMIKDKNSELKEKTPELDAKRLERVIEKLEKYESLQKDLSEAVKKNDSPAVERLVKEQEELKKAMESKEFRQDLEMGAEDLSQAFNTLRSDLGSTYDGLLKSLVQFGRKLPLEQMPQDLPQGLKGFAISNEQFKSMVSQGQFKLPEKHLGQYELPTTKDLQEINKILRFTDAATQEINRASLEQQFSLAKARINQIDSTGELAKKWFPEKPEDLSDAQIEKRLAAATPWIQKGMEVQRYGELHHRFNKMINEQFTWPSWLGGQPSSWDASAIEKHKDLVSVTKDEKSGRVSISVKMPESLERNDENSERLRALDSWLDKYKKPVDQVLGELDAAKAENHVIYWGDIKSEMRVDKDGNMIEKGWKDAQGRQVMQESDGRKYRFTDEGEKEWVPPSEKLTDAEFRVINGRVVWVEPGEKIEDVNLLEFRAEAKETKNEKGETVIEIKQKQTLQYAHWASYQGWGWVSDIKTMGADIKAEKIDKDSKIPVEIGVPAGGRRDGKAGDYLVTLPDGRKQFIEAKSFEKLYRAKEGGAQGEFEEKPRQYKPDDWVVVFRTDSGIPQPTLMQAKDVPGFCSSQKGWHYGLKAVTTAVDALLLIGGVAELKAAMVGVEAAAGTAAKLTTMQVIGRALLTHQGAFGAFHAGLGATGFLGQGIENLGPAGKTFMHIRAIAMLADLGYTALGRPLSPAGFVPTAEQLAGQGFMTRALLNFNHAFNETALTSLLRLDKAAESLGRIQALQRIGQFLSPLAVAGRLPGAQMIGNFLANASVGRMQALGADAFFLSDIGFRQIPGIVNRFRGTDAQHVQQKAALERRWPQSTLEEDRKSPSGFDKQTMMRIEAFRKPTEEAMKLPEDNAERIALNKKLIETVKSEKSDAKDRLGAAFALVTLNSKDGVLPEKLGPEGSSIEKAELHKFVDSQRFLQAKEVIEGYTQGLKLHVSDELKVKLDKLNAAARLAFSDDDKERNASMQELISVFNNPSTSAEEKTLAASSILFARRRDAKGDLSEAVKAGEAEVKAKALIEYLHAGAQAKQGEGSAAKANPGHIRLFAGDMLLRMDIDRFSLADMSQICLSIVNDKASPRDEAEKERLAQLKLQAMVDAHGLRLGDLYEVMKSRVEPEIAAMQASESKDKEAKGMALASLHGRDSEAIRKTLEQLRHNQNDPRIAALSSYLLFAGSQEKASDRLAAFSKLHAGDSPLSFPQGFARQAQTKWSEEANKEILAKLKSELPARAGAGFDQAANAKYLAAQELIARYPDLKANLEIQSEINNALMSLVTADNPTLAAKALPLLLKRASEFDKIFKETKTELAPPMKAIKEQFFGGGAIMETLQDASLDLLKDSATYSSYTARAENLSKDIASLQEELAVKKDKLSENDIALLQNKIHELNLEYNKAASAPIEFKKALLKALPDLLKGASAATLAAYKKAALDLASVNAERPETASPELRAQAIKSAVSIAGPDKALSGHFAGILADDPSPLARLAALEALKIIQPENLQQTVLRQLSLEKHPEIAKSLREVEFSHRRPDPDTAEYQEKFNKARIDLINQASRTLTGAEDFLKANADLKSLDGQTLREQALSELKDLYFNGVGGFFRFVWEGEKGVDSDHAKLLDKYAGKMREAMDSLGKRAATDDEALKALVYIALSNGRPLLKDDRNWGVEKATEKLKEICQNASAERAKQIAWASEMLLLHQPAMSAAGRQNVLESIKALVAKPGQSGISNSQVATMLATALQRELRNTPAPGAKDYAAREKLQKDMLDMLAEPRFRTKDILPALEALAEGSPKFKVLKNEQGDVYKVEYADGSTRELQKRAGDPFKYIFKDSQGKETVWLADPANPKTWYKDTDKEKKEPWTGSAYFEKNGDYVRVSDKTGNKTLFKANGGQIDLVGSQVAKVIYPDGSSREFEPPGQKYKRYIFTHADGKTKEVWEREGESSKFFKQGDTERKNPWVGEEFLDPASGDYVSVQGQTRTIVKPSGAKLQIKDGAMIELAAPASNAYNTALAPVRLKAQEMLASLSDRSDLIRAQVQLEEGANAASIARKIESEIANPRANSEKVGKAIALSEKLGAIKSDDDPRRQALQIAARDGHELVRLMAARELAASSNSEDRKLAYSVLARLEKQGTRAGYVSESAEIIRSILQNAQVSRMDKDLLAAARQEASKLDPASYKANDRLADVSNNLDYQDAYERARIELKENALRKRSLDKYAGSHNWFSKSESYNLLDSDKIREAQKQAVHDAYPGPIKWLFMSRASIDKVCDDAVKEVWRRQEKQLAALGEAAKLESGREAREALASIILTQGQPLREGDRVWAMQEAAKMIRDCIKDGHPGSRDMLWVIKAALIEEPALDQLTRFRLMNALDLSKEKGIVDAKEASITMAAALESEFKGMPSASKAPEAYKESLENQKYAMTLIGLWRNPEASPALEAMSIHHPDAAVRQRAKEMLMLLNLSRPNPRLRSDLGAQHPERRADAGGKANNIGHGAEQLALQNIDQQILELERVRLGLPAGSSKEQIEKALKKEAGLA